ncbi:MAG: hypothetical protein CMO80_13115 [Verrucomicrobiales bacterium]|nr:hypothetical protein [Verrucomicrobiales bacterium]
MTASTTRSAFELYREPSTVREQYGRHKFGQSTLLARRLIEAGGRLAQDLEERGPLSETLVAVFGEFGRTPKFIRYGGRDH